jgi:hypothetical protein
MVIAAARTVLIAMIAALVAAADAPAPQVAQDAIARHEAEVAAANGRYPRGERTGTLVFPVVDQAGRPVTGIPLPVTITRIDRNVPAAQVRPGDTPEETVQAAPVTDDQGVARVSVPRFLLVTAGFTAPPPGFLVTDGDDASWSEYSDGVPFGGPADQHAFTLYRMTGPEPLVRWTTSLLHPADGGELGLDLFARPHPAAPGEAVAAVDADHADLLVRVWRDPAAPLREPGPRMHEIPLTPAASWWVELTCLRGGLTPCHDALPFHAPEAGYVRTLRWAMDRPADRSFRAGPWCGVYWRRAGTPDGSTPPARACWNARSPALRGTRARRIGSPTSPTTSAARGRPNPATRAEPPPPAR